MIAECLDNGTTVEEATPFLQTDYAGVVKGAEGDREWLGFTLTFDNAWIVTNEDLAAGMLLADYNGPLTENMELYQTTINDNLVGAMADVIMGEDISVYRKAVEDWYANGGQAITEDVNAYYASLK